MEMKGLERCFKTLKEADIQITELVTDRHPQIRCYMRDFQTDIKHTFDTWHINKSLFDQM